MKTFFKDKSVWIIVMLVVSVLYSCDPTLMPTRYLYAPTWIEINKVSNERIDLRWEPVEDAKQYIIYKVFLNAGWYGETSTAKTFETYASQYEIARTSVPQYQYQGSYDPVENGYPSSYACFFGVRVVDENGNMSWVQVIEVPKTKK